MADDQPPVDPPLLREYFIPIEYDQHTAAMGPDIGASQYEIKALVINILLTFHGIENEDLYTHIDEFLDVCATVRVHGVDDDALRLRLFPFSLKEKAKYWLKSLSFWVRIRSWHELQREFLKKYFPRSHTQTLQQLENQIGHLASTINHRQDESFPSQPVNNPKGKGVLNIADDPGPHGANAILTLRSGRDYHPSESQDHPSQCSDRNPPTSIHPVHISGAPEASSNSHRPHVDSFPPFSITFIPSTTPPPPSPKALGKPSPSSLPTSGKEVKMQELYDLFRSVSVNIHLLDAISQVPVYARFLKDLCTQKRQSKKTPVSVVFNE
ncbi:unnamed protein product [Victoria cruziana]